MYEYTYMVHYVHTYVRTYVLTYAQKPMHFQGQVEYMDKPATQHNMGMEAFLC